MCVKQNTTLVVTAAAAVQDPFEGGGGGGRGGEREREREREEKEKEEEQYTAK
jgi:ribosomal protein L12E/L44/L45/RPP1/RPP2